MVMRSTYHKLLAKLGLFAWRKKEVAKSFISLEGFGSYNEKNCQLGVVFIKVSK